MSRLYLLGFYVALLTYILTPALATSCYPADYSIPATAHNHKVAKLTDRAKRAYTLEIKTHKPYQYLLVYRGGQTYRYYYNRGEEIQTYVNGRYIILYDTTTDIYYIKRQPSPYTTRLICID